MKSFTVLLLTIIFPLLSIGQTLEDQERELLIKLDALRNATSNSDKKLANQAFKTLLEETIQMKGAFEYPFNTLTTLGSIKSPDNKLRLFNWNVEQDDMTQKYYCYTLHFDDRKKEWQMNELIDNSIMLPARPTEVLEANEWYGALYYRIIPIKKGSKTLYTVLGWDGNTTLSTIKLMDVLYFNGSNPKLGSPIFKTEEGTFKRLFFEHSKKATMYLNYEEDRDRIIMYHLSPETPSMKGIYSFYVPDLSYDAFELEKGKWYLKEDVIGVNNAEEEKHVVYIKDPKTGKLVEKTVKNKWEDPTDKGAPGGGSEHVAVTPDGDPPKTDKKKKTKVSRKERKNTPKSYNPVGSKK